MLKISLTRILYLLKFVGWSARRELGTKPKGILSLLELVVGLCTLSNAKRLQPYWYDADIAGGLLGVGNAVTPYGTPIFSRGPHCKWTSEWGSLASMNKGKRTYWLDLKTIKECLPS